MQVKNYDPCAEIFQFFDPSGSGIVETTILKDVFAALGFFDEISEDELKVCAIIECDNSSSKLVRTNIAIFRLTHALTVSQFRF